MEKIISKIYELIKSTENLIELEERIQWFMYDVFSTLLGEVFTKIDQAIVKKKQAEGWTVKRRDSKTIQFTFGAVSFQHTLEETEKDIHTTFLMNGSDFGNISALVLWWK